MATWWFKGRNTRDLVQSKMMAFPSLSKRMLKRNRQEEEANTSSASSSPSVSNRCRHGLLRRHHKHHRHVHSSPATDITTLEVSIHSESGQPVTRVVRPQGKFKITFYGLKWIISSKSFLWIQVIIKDHLRDEQKDATWDGGFRNRADINCRKSILAIMI